MTIPAAVIIFLSENAFGEVRTRQGVGGGCINNGSRLFTASGETFFLKTNSSAPVDMFAREAEGLQALEVPAGLSCRALSYTERILSCWKTWLRPLAAPITGRSSAASWPCCTTGYTRHLVFTMITILAAHRSRIRGSHDGYRFFAEHRLLFQGSLAVQRGLLGRAEQSRVEGWLTAYHSSCLPNRLHCCTATCGVAMQPPPGWDCLR